MAISDSYPWSQLVPGAFVYDAQGVPWKLIEEHPQRKGTFRAVNIDGDTAVVSDPGRPVRARVPGHEEALRHLHDILGARASEGKFTVEALPTAGRGAAARVRAHLKTMHGGYYEPSMKLPMLLAAHRSSHARGEVHIPHTHRGENPYG